MPEETCPLVNLKWEFITPLAALHKYVPLVSTTLTPHRIPLFPPAATNNSMVPSHFCLFWQTIAEEFSSFYHTEEHLLLLLPATLPCASPCAGFVQPQAPQVPTSSLLNIVQSSAGRTKRSGSGIAPLSRVNHTGSEDYAFFWMLSALQIWK